MYKIFVFAIALIFAGAIPAFASSTLPESCAYPWLDWIFDFLPKTPDELKLANILTEFALEAPLGTGLIFEAYSLSWQILSTMAFFKGLKLLALIKFLFR